MSAERDQAYFDIFVTALEGGIGYWSICKSYRWRKPDTKDEDVLGFEAFIAEDDDPSKEFLINREVIVKGVDRFVNFAKSHSSNPYWKSAAIDLDWGHWDDLDYDAEIADVIVQLGLFGEAVYG